jgi:hypothetical protein
MFNRSNKLDRILSKCIRSIEEKGWTIEDCLNQYPSSREELEPMLRTALRLRQARRYGPSTAFRANAQIRIRKRLQSSRRSPSLAKSTQSSTLQKRGTIALPQMRLAGSLIPLLLISLFIIGAGGGIAFAADHARPGDVLYQVDRAIEHIRIQLENDVQQMVRLHLQFADERLKEVVELVEQGDAKDLSSALADYKEQIVATAPLIQQAQIEGKDINNLIIETSDMIDAQKKKLQDLIEESPIEYEAAIQDTIDDAEKVQKVVVSPVPTEEPFVFEPEIPSKPLPTNIPPTAPSMGIPPSATETPGAFILPTNTVPLPASPTPPYAISPTSIPGNTAPAYTPTKTNTPTPTPTPTHTMTPTATLPKGGPTTPPAVK